MEFCTHKKKIQTTPTKAGKKYSFQTVAMGMLDITIASRSLDISLHVPADKIFEINKY